MDSGVESLRRFVSELRRRRVVRVALVYGVAAWALLQGLDALLPLLEAPAWVGKVMLALLVLGFPAAVALAWAFDITPEGVKRTPDQAVSAAPAARSGRVLLVAAIAIALAGGGLWAANRQSAGSAALATPTPLSIAVLPFANMSGDPQNEYFSDGMTEDILTQLAKLEQLTVTSRTSVMQYKNTTKTVREIAGELGVGAILEGSVRQSGGRVRITAQLIEAGTDRHLWAETYDRDMQDIFAVQTDVARNIANALRVQLTPADLAHLEEQPTDNVQAYQLYLQGRYASNRVVASEMETGILLFERAIELDPEFAAAYAAMAQSYVWMSIVAQREPHAIYEPAIAAVRRALELDPESVHAYAALGALKIGFEWDWPGADVALDRALELDPHNEDALSWKALSLMFRNRRDEAEAMAHRLVARDSNSSSAVSALGQVLAVSGKTAEAIPVLERARELNPNAQANQYWLMYAYLHEDRFEEADVAYERTFDNNAPVPLWEAIRASVLASAGRPEEARSTLAKLRQQAADGEYVPPYAFMSLHASLGEMDAAMRELQLAVAERSPILIYIRAVPRMRPMRSDPRFMDALRTIWPDDFD